MKTARLLNWDLCETPYTALADRVLWYDGDETLTSKQLTHRALTGGVISNCTTVTKMTNDVQKYNELVPKSERISVKTELKDWTQQWVLPEEYQSVNLSELLEARLVAHLENVPHNQHKLYVRTYLHEVKLYHQHDLMDFLLVIHYIVETLTKKNQVWGVGRGSSVASFILFLLRAHDVDSVKYELNVTDFLRET